jgi:hypothetical protein
MHCAIRRKNKIIVIIGLENRLVVLNYHAIWVVINHEMTCFNPDLLLKCLKCNTLKNYALKVVLILVFVFHFHYNMPPFSGSRGDGLEEI